MLKEAKLAMAITTAAYDAEIAELLKAGARDLTAAGVRLPGTVAFTISTSGAVTDNSSMKEPLIMRAIITYARMYFRSPDDFDRLERAYDTQKVTLMHASGYTNYGGECDGES